MTKPFKIQVLTEAAGLVTWHMCTKLANQ